MFTQINSQKKKIPTNTGNVEMSSPHEKNTFVLTEPTQTQMPRENVRKYFLLKFPKWRTNSGKNI